MVRRFVLGFLLSSLSWSLVGQAKSIEEVLYLIRCGSFEEVKSAFENSGDKVDSNAQRSDGMTPILMAAHEGRGDVVLYLFLNQKADPLATDSRKYTVVHLAALQGHLGVLQILGSNLVESNPHLWNQLLIAQDDQGLTALHLAARSGHEDVVGFLLSVGANPHALDGGGRSPFYWAIKNGKEGVARILLTSKLFSINYQNSWGMTALHEAAREGSLSVVRGLVNAKAQVNPRDVDGRTPLYWACERGYGPVVKFLLTHGADPSLMDDDRRNILHRAARYGHAEVVQLLLKKTKLGVNSVDSLGNTALSWAVRNGHLDAVKVLVAAGADMSVLKRSGTNDFQEASARGYEDTIRFLVAQGYDVNQEDEKGKTALHYASAADNVRMISTLLGLKAQANHKDQEGRTPLDDAVVTGKKGAVVQLANHMLGQSSDQRGLEKSLRKASKTGNTLTAEAILNEVRGDRVKLKTLIDSSGFDLYQKDTSGKTVFDYALDHHHVQLLTFLLLSGDVSVDLKALKNQGGNLDALDEKDGMAMIHYGALMGETSLVKSLLSSGASATLQEAKSGDTALHEAVGAKNAQVVDALLKARASFSVKNQAGLTPFIQAMQQGFGEGVSLFLAAGADADLLVGELTPFQMAVKTNNTQMLEIFMNHVKGDSRALDKFDRKEIVWDMQDSQGMGIGHWVCKNGHTGLLDVLLDISKMVNKANFQGIDKSGRTPLHYAAEKGYSDIISKLLKSKDNAPDVDAVSNDRTTAVDEAALHGQEKALETLLASGGHPVFLDTKDHAEKVLEEHHVGEGALKILDQLFPPPPPAIAPVVDGKQPVKSSPALPAGSLTKAPTLLTKKNSLAAAAA